MDMKKAKRNVSGALGIIGHMAAREETPDQLSDLHRHTIGARDGCERLFRQFIAEAQGYSENVAC